MIEDCFYGAVTVGERGQVVIPSDARASLGIRQGDKLLVMKHPMHKGLIMAKLEDVSRLIEDLRKSVERAHALEEE